MKIKLIGLIAIIFSACNASHQSGILSVTDFKAKSATEGATIIDVRTPEEFNGGYIKGAVNIDYQGTDFDTEVAKLDKEKPYFLYCKSGKRSGNALDKMKAAGFKNVYGLDGGIEAWTNEKQAVELPGSSAQNTSPAAADPTDFKTAIFGDKLVLVDFNATWCGPCKRMQPFVDMIKEERNKEVIVFSIDTDEQTALAQEYQIQNLPTVMLIKNGSVLYREEGYHDQESLNELVTKFK